MYARIWIVVHEQNNKMYYDSITLGRNTSIKKFIEGTTLSWKECYNMGYRCKLATLETFN
jgi:hypothetical protein